MCPKCPKCPKISSRKRQKYPGCGGWEPRPGTMKLLLPSRYPSAFRRSSGLASSLAPPTHSNTTAARRKPVSETVSSVSTHLSFSISLGCGADRAWQGWQGLAELGGHASCKSGYPGGKWSRVIQELLSAGAGDAECLAASQSGRGFRLFSLELLWLGGAGQSHATYLSHSQWSLLAWQLSNFSYRF